MRPTRRSTAPASSWTSGGPSTSAIGAIVPGRPSVGDTVTLAEAVTKKKASACWEGVRRRAMTVPIVVEEVEEVEEVEVDGVHERVPGSIAFVPVTEGWLPPMREVWDGVLGSQDVNICR